MALIFLGRVGLDRYIEKTPNDDGTITETTKERPDQQFQSGVMVFKEQVKAKLSQGFVNVESPDGKVLVGENGLPVRKEVFADGVQTLSHGFKPQDIGKPYDKFKDEAEIMARYPGTFKKG